MDGDLKSIDMSHIKHLIVRDTHSAFQHTFIHSKLELLEFSNRGSNLRYCEWPHKFNWCNLKEIRNIHMDYAESEWDPQKDSWIKYLLGGNRKRHPNIKSISFSLGGRTDIISHFGRWHNAATVH